MNFYERSSSAESDGEIPGLLQGLDKSEREHVLPLLVQKKLMMLMLPLRLRELVSPAINKDSDLATELFMLWAERYGQAFRNGINDLIAAHSVEPALAERYKTGSLTIDDYHYLINQLMGTEEWSFTEEEIDELIATCAV